VTEFRVPFLELAPGVTVIRDELRQACDDVLASGIYLNGPRLERLEWEISQRCANFHVIGVGSGTQALQILLLAHGIGPGDEVITTAASFFATAKAIVLVGAHPVLVDVRPDDYNIDCAQVERAITPRTKAVLAVHLYGRPVDIGRLRQLTTAAGILLLEDAAHALGASVDGQPAGALGDGAALSFYPTKNLGAMGDAGAVVVRDGNVAHRARAGRFLGSSGIRDHFSLEGISGRMDELQAACLLVRLRHFDRWQAARAEIAARYRAALPPELLLPGLAPGVADAHHLFVIRHCQRDALAERLAHSGVQTMVHYRVPLHRQPVLGSQPSSLPVAENWSHEVLSLPLNQMLSAADQEHVIAAVVDALGQFPAAVSSS
jgi:dTDP-4-amino-4,6-dideoxygalactose transaminase